MNAPLRINEALLIAGHAFLPFDCIAWAPLEGGSELSLTVVDRTGTRTLGRTQVPISTYSDPARLESLLEETRHQLSKDGYSLQPWQMPA